MASSIDFSESREDKEECSNGNVQEKEVIELRRSYGKYCKIIENIGDFTNVVTVSRDGSALTLKFQLEATYPSTVPGIIVKNTCLDLSQLEELNSSLNAKANSFLGAKMIIKLVEYAYEWCESRECTVIPSEKETQTKNKQTKRKQKKQVNENESKSWKLPSMKTAEDVISRIMWDQTIPTESFTVGYIDRFVGVVERKFMEFSWEDLASVDYDTLAIPKHRIQYFKYKNLIVWDKNKRLDNIFGSTGSGLKITDMIEQYKENQESKSQGVSGSDDSDSGSDDEDVVITVDGKLNEDGVEYTRDKYWGPKKRPTHFMCLRVTSPEIIDAMKEVHKQIIEIEPSYEESLIPIEKLHMTLACLGLDDDIDVEQASEFLRDIQPDLEQFRPKEIEVDFHGVDHFFHNVLYAKVKPNEDMLKFVNYLRECVQKAGIEIRDVFDFTPHMTVLKFKKHHQAMAHTRYIDPKLYDRFAHTSFGVQHFRNIHLCKMTTEASAEGFYICPRKIKF